MSIDIFTLIIELLKLYIVNVLAVVIINTMNIKCLLARISSCNKKMKEKKIPKEVKKIITARTFIPILNFFQAMIIVADSDKRVEEALNILYENGYLEEKAYQKDEIPYDLETGIQILCSAEESNNFIKEEEESVQNNELTDQEKIKLIKLKTIKLYYMLEERANKAGLSIINPLSASEDKGFSLEIERKK